MLCFYPWTIRTWRVISRVLVAMDGSELAERALRYALELHPETEITVLTVVGEPSAMFGEATAIALAIDSIDSVEEYARPVLTRAREIADEYDREISTEIRTGHPARAIVKRSEEFDLVVIGSHGGTLSDRLFTGNVAEKVFRRARVPVTIVR